MNVGEAGHAARAVAPWLEAVDDLRTWHAAWAASPAGGPPAPEVSAALATLCGVLAAMGRGEEAIPRELPASALHRTAALEGWLRPAPAGPDLRRRRGLVLRLGLWRVLRALGRHGAAAGAPLEGLHGRLAAAALEVPPGLGPALGYALGDTAAPFFDGTLRRTLQRLAKLHDAGGAHYAALAQEPSFEATGVAVHRWSTAWSAAVVGVYLDWLHHRNGGDPESAMRQLWRDEASQLRFRAPAEMAAVPSRERSMHIDLWTNVVVAQTLVHSDTRWAPACAGQRWHRVRVSMHDLGEQSRGSRAKGEVRTVVRGLGVEMLYQAVFIDRMARLPELQDGPPNRPDAPAQAPPQTIELQLASPRPGHESNFRFVIRWREGEPTASEPRFAGPPPALALTRAQQAVVQRWQSNHRRAPSRGLARASLDWAPAGELDRFEDETPTPLLALGHAALWQAAGEDAQWLDLALMVHLQGCWHDLPVVQLDEWRDGTLRSWLLLETWPAALATRAPAELAEALACAQRSCWVGQAAGAGVFVMAALDLDRPAPPPAGP